MATSTAQFPHVDGFILVGGKSSRMGRDKTLLEIGGKPLLRRTAELLAPLVASISLVVSAEELSPADDASEPRQYAQFGFHLVADLWPNAGPLGAIATALGEARKTWSLALACDLPYLSGDWLAWLLGRTSNSSADIIIPESVRGLEPLCAGYRSACAPVLAAALDRGVRKVTDSFTGLNVERISESEWRKFSPDGTLFRNMNTWEDYIEARTRLED